MSKQGFQRLSSALFPFWTRLQPKRRKAFYSFGLIWSILWMDALLHHFETMGSQCSLLFTGDCSFQGFLGGAKMISSIHSMSVPKGDHLSCSGRSLATECRHNQLSTKELRFVVMVAGVWQGPTNFH